MAIESATGFDGAAQVRRAGRYCAEANQSGRI